MITITQPWKITGSVELNDGWSVGCIYVYYFLPPFQGNLRLLLPGGGSCTLWWADYNPSYYNNVRNDLCDSSRANGLSCLNILYLAQWPLNSRVCIHFLVSIFYFLQRLLSNNTNLIFSFLCFGGFSHYCFFACLLLLSDSELLKCRHYLLSCSFVSLFMCSWNPAQLVHYHNYMREWVVISSTLIQSF